MLSLNLQPKTWAHHIPVGAKLLILTLTSVALFPVQSLWIMCAALFVTAMLYASLGAHGLRAGAKGLKPLFWFVALIAVYHVVTRDITGGVLLIMRMLTLVGMANFVTMTSRLDDMIDLVMRLLGPLRRIGVPVAGIGLAFAMVIRFTPVLIAKGTFVIEAWRARSARVANWRVIVPITLVAIDDADHLAEALRARGGAE